MKLLKGILLCFFLCLNTFFCNNNNKMRGASQRKTKAKVDLTVCPAGFYLGPRIGHKPSANGCGPEGNTMLVLALSEMAPEMQKCCYNHDICYEICKPDSKEACDNEFYYCMKTQCDETYPSWWQWFSRTGCKIKAYTMWASVSKGGQDPFTVAQNKACDCLPNNATTTTSNSTISTNSTIANTTHNKTGPN